MRRSDPLFCSLLFLLFLITSLGGVEPLAVYTLLEDHPEERMAIQWVTPEEKNHRSLIFSNEEGEQWFRVEGVRNTLPLPQTLYVHRVVLEELTPETSYQFKFEPNGKVYHFKTLPKGLSRPITFVAGGDIYHDSLDYVRTMNLAVRDKNPDFVMLGGDIAYAHSRISFIPESIQMWTQEILKKLHIGSNQRTRWIEWLRAWSEDMVAADGRIIPFVSTIGNHDVNGGFNETPESAQMYYLLLGGNKEKVYQVIDIGSDLSIIALDSGHTAPIGGEQTLWLYHALKERASVSKKFAFYHVPAYPSVRSLQTKQSVLIRKFWVPFFDLFGLNAAFEHHDHTYKRTLPLRNGKEHPTGVVYFGDGAWGIKKPRKPKADRWFLAKSEQTRNVIFVEVSKEKVTYTALDDTGAVIDQLER